MGIDIYGVEFFVGCFVEFDVGCEKGSGGILGFIFYEDMVGYEV